MTKEDIIRMAIEAGWDAHHAEFDTRIQTFAALVASAEREACAVFSEECVCGCGRSSCIDGDLRAHDIAVSIRTREQE